MQEEIALSDSDQESDGDIYGAWAKKEVGSHKMYQTYTGHPFEKSVIIIVTYHDKLLVEKCIFINGDQIQPPTPMPMG